jgi:hypothetical protein
MHTFTRYMLCSACLSLTLAFCLLQTGAAFAHGGVSHERDTCVVKLGPYKMHFTGYELETKLSREFCEEIPDAGGVIIVLDEFSKVMRHMAMGFRVIRDVKDLGSSAQYEQLGGDKEIESASIFYKNPEVYVNGTLTLDFTFEKGKYIGIVTLVDPETKQTFISSFPFSVGYGSAREILNPALGMIAALLAGGAIVVFTSRRQKENRKPSFPNAPVGF